MKIHNPPELGIIPDKYSAIYSHAVERQSDGFRQLFISGQVGVDESGIIGKTFTEQLTIAMQKVEIILESAKMSLDNISKVTYYLTHREDLDALITVRSDRWSGVHPAITVVLVSGLVHPDWLVEVDVIAHERLSDDDRKKS